MLRMDMTNHMHPSKATVRAGQKMPVSSMEDAVHVQQVEVEEDCRFKIL